MKRKVVAALIHGPKHSPTTLLLSFNVDMNIFD